MVLFSVQNVNFFPYPIYLYFLDNKKQKYTSRPSVLFHLQQRDVQNAISDKKYNKMMEGGEKHQYERMHLVIRTLNNRDCGIYIYELYECTLGCKVVKLILYLLPLQPVTRKSGQGRKKNEQKRSKYSTILFSVFYHTDIIQLQSQYYSLYGRYMYVVVI